MRSDPMRLAVAASFLLLAVASGSVRVATAAPEGTLTWGVHVPIFELAFLWGVGPRVEEACIDHIKGFAYSAPYEDLKIKAGK